MAKKIMLQKSNEVKNQEDVSTSSAISHSEIIALKTMALAVVKQCEQMEKKIGPGKKPSKKNPLTEEQVQAYLHPRMKRFTKKSA